MIINKEHCNKAAQEVGAKNDCGVRAVACALQVPYMEVREALKRHKALRQCGGIKWHGVRAVIEENGSSMIEMHDYTQDGAHAIKWHMGRTINPHGTYIVHQRGHVYCIKHGEIQDWMSENRRHTVQHVWQIVSHAGLTKLSTRIERTMEHSAVKAGV